MKRQQVKNLQDEFTNLFDGDQQQHIKTDKNLMHLNNRLQQPQQSNSGTFKQLDYPESENEEDFFDQIDEVLNQGEEGQNQPSRRQVMLNYKINQLQIKCRDLKNANIILRQKIIELQQPKSEIKSQSSLQANQSDLTVMQQDFAELQEELSNYKYQLSTYQKNMSQKMRQKEYQFDSLRIQLNEYKNQRINIQTLYQQLSEKDRIIALLERKNQELLLQLQEEKQKWSFRDIRRHDSYFDDKISTQMQNLIDKLLKQLKFEKKTTAKQLTEIKRLNAQLLQMQGVLKEKNKQVYQLEFSLIKANKTQQQKKDQNLNFRQKQRAFQKSEYYESPSGYPNEDLSPYIPQRSQRGNNLMSPRRPAQYQMQNKNLSIQSNRSYDKNRMSAEREGVTRAVVGVNVLSKSLTFTLMDLLNKEFKIRQAQKQIIACRTIDLYSRKIMQGNYENLIPEQIQIYNFSSQNPIQIKVRANLMASKGDREQASENELLYNMSFILDTLLNQVQVVDAFVQNYLDLNVNEYVSQLQMKNSKEEKYKFLQQLSNNIESYYINS